MMAYATGTDLTSECPEVNSSVRRLYNLPLGGLKEFSTTMVTDINDLPATSPHGSDFRHHTQILGLASLPSDTRGTAAAHRTFSSPWKIQAAMKSAATPLIYPSSEISDIEAVEMVFKDGVSYDPAKLLNSAVAWLAYASTRTVAFRNIVLDKSGSHRVIKNRNLRTGNICLVVQ